MKFDYSLHFEFIGIATSNLSVFEGGRTPIKLYHSKLQNENLRTLALEAPVDETGPIMEALSSTKVEWWGRHIAILLLKDAHASQTSESTCDIAMI